MGFAKKVSKGLLTAALGFSLMVGVHTLISAIQRLRITRLQQVHSIWR